MSSKPQRLFPPVTGAIFAGGESRRMGQPKEGLRLWDNRPMLAHGIDALSPLCPQIAIVGDCQGFDISTDSRLIKISDRKPGLGPLSALDALLASGLSSHYLIASCDQPLLNASLLQLLVEQVETHPDCPIFFQGQDGESLDPFPGIYPAVLLPKVEEALAGEQYAIRKLLQQVPTHWVQLLVEQEICLSNCNTPASVSELSQRVSLQGSAS